MNRYYVIGDIHGNWRKLCLLLEDMTLDDHTYVIMCGDVGIVYGDNKYGELLHKMKGFPCKFIVMRGNHDARYWKAYRERGESLEVVDMFGNQIAYQRKYPNVLYIKDEGGLYDFEDLGKCLFIPGAYSVDKWYRLRNGLPWEHDEQLTYKEMDAIVETALSNRIDFVFSHTCPWSWTDQFSDLFLSGLDQDSVDKTMEKWLEPVYDITKDKYKMWFFGHYHDDRAVKAGDGNVVGIMLYNTWMELGGDIER